MGYWQVLLPEAGTNLLSNGSLETNTTGWTASGSAISRVTTASAFGFCALQIIDNNAAANEGAYYSVNPSDTAAAHTASIYVWAAAAGGTVRIRLRDQTNGTETASSAVTLTTTPQRINVSHTTGAASADLRLYVETSAQQAKTWLADGAMIQQLSYVTTYIDGDQEGCTWTGTAHGSTSTRSSQSRAGGRWRDFVDDYSVGVVGMVGFGMPDLQHNTTPYSILPGGLLQSIKTKQRDFALIMEPAGGSLTTLHTRRDSVIEAIKPDLVSPVQPVRLKYSGATNEVVIAAHYAGGLEGNFDGDKGVQERFGVKFVAYDPYFEKEIDSAATVTTKLSVADADNVIKKIDGAWTNVSTQFNGNGGPMVRDAAGNIYIGGNFTNVGDANGDYIVMVAPDGTISSLGTGVNNTVFALAVAPDGVTIYAGGSFTSAGGVANTNYIARWTGSVWQSLSATQPGAGVRALAFDQSGNLYVGGAFTNLADANGDYISRWDGSTYNSMGTGMNNTVLALLVDVSNNLYAGGSFTSAGGVANTDNIAKWTGSAWTSVSSSITGSLVNAIAETDDGMIYAGGDFTAIGGVTASRIARYNGAVWTALGNGVNSEVNALYPVDNLLYASGSFTSAGGLSLADSIAIWNGTTWLHVDVDLPGATIVEGVLEFNGDLYFTYTTTGTATTSALTTVTNNGSTAAYPKLVIKRTGGTSATLEWLKNETTGKTIWFNYALLDGETLTIDFAPGNKTITSSMFGNVIGRALLPGSDFSTWALQPGSNSVSLFIADAGTPTMTAYLQWKDSFWSPDGSIS